MKIINTFSHNKIQQASYSGEDTAKLPMHNNIFRKTKLRFPIRVVQMLMVFGALQYSVIGYCGTRNGWVDHLFESKGRNMKDVAVQIAELPEKYKITVQGVDFSADGKLLAVGSADETINIWDWQDGRVVRTLKKAQGANTGLTTEPIRFSPDGRLFVACHSRAAGDIVTRIWNTDTWEIAHDIIDDIPGGCKATGFTPDGKSLIRILDRPPKYTQDALVVYSTNTWLPVWGLRTLPLHAQALATSPDGKFIALGGYISGVDPILWKFIIVDVKQRTIIHTIQSKIIDRLAWSPDGSYITVLGSMAMQIFEAQSGKLVVEQSSAGTHSSLRYTPDGKYLIEGDMNGKGTGNGVRIWDGQHRELLQEIPGNVGSLAVSRDSHYFAMGVEKKTIIWQLK